MMRLLDMLSSRIFEYSNYSTYFIEVLKIAALPPKLSKVSDVLTYSRDLEEYFSTLCKFPFSLQLYQRALCSAFSSFHGIFER